MVNILKYLKHKLSLEKDDITGEYEFGTWAREFTDLKKKFSNWFFEEKLPPKPMPQDLIDDLRERNAPESFSRYDRLCIFYRRYIRKVPLILGAMVLGGVAITFSTRLVVALVRFLRIIP